MDTIVNLTVLNIEPLNFKELKKYRGGGFLVEFAYWLKGAWDVHSARIQMSPAERELLLLKNMASEIIININLINVTLEY